MVACTSTCVWVMSRFILMRIHIIALVWLVLYLLSVVHFDNNRQTSHKNPMTIPPLMRSGGVAQVRASPLRHEKKGLCVVVT